MIGFLCMVSLSPLLIILLSSVLKEERYDSVFEEFAIC